MDKPTLSVVASFYVIIPVLLILAVVSVYLRAQQMSGVQDKQTRWLTVILLLIYLIVYVWLTFLFRSPGAGPRTRLVPFGTYREAFGLFRIKSAGLARAIIFNILLTVPVGLLVPLLFERHPYLKTAGVSLLLSILTEGIQYITQLGICETDDVIGNLLGCLFGMGIMATGTRLIQGHMKKF